ncbi:MAG: nucleoside 2-deoxyribosyltransferase [Candidatus Dojkabacteria bacterium]|nr:nucleoside 2-deoxyribosyltransferase [Candidatus Dojkabacteria bacterium]MDQ7020853.1 nucleoside 2-deoxyribosyltransferase [Candidatus Dojkabacteria bacterium]
MKIYFAGSIRGGRKDKEVYFEIIESLKSYGEVLTEHVGSLPLSARGEHEVKEDFIYKRDIEWLESSDIVIAEVTNPSLGVGYELAYAEKLKIPVHCFFNPEKYQSLSAMIRGDKYLNVYDYKDLEKVNLILNNIFK